MSADRPVFPLDRFEHVGQIGGLTSATLDNGPERGSRIATLDTGAGLRATIALDRGADLAHAAFDHHGLTYLSPNGLATPPSTDDFLASWPGGLLTTAGPAATGRNGDAWPLGLHGRFASQAARVERLANADPHRGRADMLLDAVIRDSRALGPTLEIHRQFRATLGQNDLHLRDETVNRGPEHINHTLIYQTTLGWPFLDEDARLVLSGHARLWDEHHQAGTPGSIDEFKRIPAPMTAHTKGSRGFLCTPQPDDDGFAHIGLINDRLAIALELCFDLEHLPHVMVWQHYGPRGTYFLALAPFVGTPFGVAREPGRVIRLGPGQSRHTALTFRLHHIPETIDAFSSYDEKLILEHS